ncbi:MULTISPECIES: multiple monosaccharide ABC transporter permease [unclassified Actinomyces]|uniref:multiple monosaccharide ABC transporter permease n=1 Tax=unclassified Actinomyces TaxID=2609248 RepID=UPI0020179E76|nr:MULTISPECIES: multiple monosaccharide ABC transporter permease [unclassified Actinomyces]MCL3777170.1 sugar ABC transporter permease [Actinomyces sp. AC-20-1]MCL3789006.1 sugar ABC transporter permease [Actinomyces sp. 187325]MCL3791361.1 sugar ABC transporter permease [Actinomyces sp. 186855]MCL3793928.1 sugar ABC transporter permease [Actinomyces sp. 217892]
MSNVTSYLGRFLRQYGILAALVAIILLFQVLTGGLLLSPNNLASLVQQNAYVMVLAVGMVMIIIARHIDLSVGSLVGFIGGVIGLLVVNQNLPWPLVVLIAVAIGLLIGCWQGFWVAFMEIPAFIVTLAGMLVFRGLTVVLVQRTVSGLPGSFVSIANGSLPPWLGYLLNFDGVTILIGCVTIAALVLTQLRARRNAAAGRHVDSVPAFVARQIVFAAAIALVTAILAYSAGGTPIVLIIVGLVILVYSFIMNKTVFGRHVYAVGGNLKAARLSGVNVRKIDFLVFVNMGLLASLAAIITTSRAGAAVSTAGNLYEMDAIAAAYIGGAAVSGGIGRVSGAIIGALIMGVLNMGLSIMAVDSAWQQAIKGLVLLLAVAVDIVGKRRQNA